MNHQGVIVSTREHLASIAPALLIAALILASAGQYEVSTNGDQHLAVLLFGSGTGAFLLALMAKRSITGPARRFAAPAIGRRVAFGCGSALLTAAAVFAAPRPGYERAALAAWALCIPLALGAAAPDAMWSMRTYTRTTARLLAWARTREAVGLAACIVVGLIARSYSLDKFPSGIHGDEAEFGLIAQGLLKGSGPSPFGSAFLGDPALFTYLEAGALAVFGHSIVTVRLVAALSGSLAIVAFWILIRSLFGPRPAFLSTALLAGSAVAVNFSRLALNVAEVPLFACLALIAFVQAERRRSPFWWLLAGMLSGLGAYFHFGSVIVPLLLGLALAFLLVFHPAAWRAWVLGSAFMFLGALVVIAPLGTVLLTRATDTSGHMADRLIFAHWDRMAAVYHTTDAPAVLLGQLAANVLGFLQGVDGSQFYTFAESPLLSPVLGGLFVLGQILLLVRFRDSRYRLLCLWFWTFVVVGGALTIDSPEDHRLLPAVLPALAGIALLLDLIVQATAGVFGPNLARVAFAAAALVPVVAGSADLSNYFGPAADRHPWEATTVQGQYVAALGPSYRAFTLGTPIIYFSHGITRFLAPDVEGASLNNPATLPLPIPGDKKLAFLVYPQMEAYLPLLRDTYPGGQLDPVLSHSGAPLFTGYLVPKEAVEATKGLQARAAAGVPHSVDAADLSAGLASGDSVTWTGSVHAPETGTYLFRVTGGPLELQVDGAAVEQTGRVLPAGWHTLRLLGVVPQSGTALALQWQRPGKTFEDIDEQWLDNRAIPAPLEARIAGQTGAVRVERAIGFRDLAGLLRVPRPEPVTWTGTLDVGAGPRTLILQSAGPAHVSIDGAQVLASGAETDDLRSQSTPVALSAGPHLIRVEYDWRVGPGMIEVLVSGSAGDLTVLGIPVSRPTNE